MLCCSSLPSPTPGNYFYAVVVIYFTFIFYYQLDSSLFHGLKKYKIIFLYLLKFTFLSLFISSYRCELFFFFPQLLQITNESIMDALLIYSFLMDCHVHLVNKKSLAMGFNSCYCEITCMFSRVIYVVC